jgi:hypothetical protein
MRKNTVKKWTRAILTVARTKVRVTILPEL